jgi:hypothetical protein
MRMKSIGILAAVLLLSFGCGKPTPPESRSTAAHEKPTGMISRFYGLSLENTRIHPDKIEIALELAFTYDHGRSSLNLTFSGAIPKKGGKLTTWWNGYDYEADVRCEKIAVPVERWCDAAVLIITRKSPAGADAEKMHLRKKSLSQTPVVERGALHLASLKRFTQTRDLIESKKTSANVTLVEVLGGRTFFNVYFYQGGDVAHLRISGIIGNDVEIELRTYAAEAEFVQGQANVIYRETTGEFEIDNVDKNWLLPFQNLIFVRK